jgi:hypothetical protein
VAPANAYEAERPTLAPFSVMLAMTHGHEGIDVMVDDQYQGATVTGEVRLSQIVTTGSDAVEKLCQKIGIQL